jgi:pheromone shutdown-related protein TraB
MDSTSGSSSSLEPTLNTAATVKKISEEVHEIYLGESTIILVGTAHVSEKSADCVEQTIREYLPDCIAIELCEPRLQALENPNRWEETDIFEVIKNGKAYVLIAQLLLSSFQKRIAKKLGIRPGEEMLRALELSKELNISKALIDREVRTTLKRAWSNMSFWSTLKLVFGLLASLFSGEDNVTEKEIEELKQGDALSALMAEFSEILPGIKEVLIDERDKIMAMKLSQLPHRKVVAVVGAGHVPGMLQCFGKQIDVSTYEEIPPPNGTFRIIAWGIPAIIIGIFIYGFFSSGLDTSLNMLSAWFLANGIFSALGALIALAHPLTIIAAFFAAPFTSLNPTIAAGWVCGLVEALMRKPRVKDFNTIADDVSTIKGLWGNRLSKTLLVVALANIGSMIGTFVGSWKVVSLL